jgi:rhamnogalacturonan endolyase
VQKKEIKTDERLSVSFSSLKNYISIKTHVGERIGKMSVADLNGDGTYDFIVRTPA